ncbi:hypothetical protein DV738_g3115, partial [Chaetothyriales sp. CBS 135597]
MPSDTSPPSPNPKQPSAVPSYLLNGTLPLHTRTAAPLVQERQNLASSIKSTYERRPTVDLATQAEASTELSKSWIGTSDGLVTQTEPKKYEPARHARDEAPATGPPTPVASATRPASPYTLSRPIDFDGLSWPSLGTRERLDQTPEQAQARLDKLAGAVRTIFECIGEDPDREGLRGTPQRYAKALMYFTKGYEENVRDLVNGAVFHEDHDELVIVKDIEVFSLCEHHMVPFIGKMHIGYIPNRRVLGLSKLARLAEMFSRRLQVQERLTKQVALAIAEVLKPQGVAVVMESSHLCMVMRGVQKTASSTTTSCMLGAMRNSAKTREEFLSLLNRGR